MARRQYGRQYNCTARVQQGIQAGYSQPANSTGMKASAHPARDTNTATGLTR